jgi:hypothetical protein
MGSREINPERGVLLIALTKRSAADLSLYRRGQLVMRSPRVHVTTSPRAHAMIRIRKEVVGSGLSKRRAGESRRKVALSGIRSLERPVEGRKSPGNARTTVNPGVTETTAGISKLCVDLVEGSD